MCCTLTFITVFTSVVDIIVETQERAIQNVSDCCLETHLLNYKAPQSYTLTLSMVL